MNYTTHRFHSVETMTRAREWLERIGIPSSHIEVSSTGLPSLTITTDYARMAEVDMVLNAAELTDPQGWPSLQTWNETGGTTIVTSNEPKVSETQTDQIGWHPVD